MRGRRRIVAAAVVAVAVVAIAVGGWASTRRAVEGIGTVPVTVSDPDFAYEVPAGTGARLDRGERVEILPGRIDARVGQTIRIVNRDDRGYVLGPFVVGPGETMTQRFTDPGTFTGACVVHPSGEIEVTVRA